MSFPSRSQAPQSTHPLEHKNSTENNTLPTIQGISALAILIAIALLAIHSAFVFVLRKEVVPGYDFLNRMWGFDSLAYLSTAFVAICYLFVMLLCIPRSNLFAFDAVATFAPDDLITLFKTHKKKAFLLIGVATFLLVYFYKPSYARFWSMQTRVDQAMQRDFQFTQYLSMFFTYRFQQFLNYFSETPVHQSLALQSALVGALYAFFSLLVSDELGKSRFAKCSIFLLQMTSGLLVLFSGPLGFHAIAAVTILMYLYASVLCLKNRLNILVPLAAVLISIGFNLVGIALIPSFIVLMYYKHLRSRLDLQFSTVVVLVLAAVICSGELYNFGLTTKLVPLLPLSAPARSISLFDARHVWEFLNGQMLVSGCGFFLFIYLGLRAILTKDFADPVFLFLVTASLFLMGAVFAWDVTLGSWDWPVNCIGAVAYNLTGIYVLVSRREVSEPSPDLRYALVLLVAFNLFNVIPWLAVNASEKSIDKTEQMAIHDPGSYHVTASSPLLELTLFCYQNGKGEQALKFASRAIAQIPQDPRSHFNMAILMVDLGRLDQANRILRVMIDRFPYYAPAYKNLIALSEKVGDHATTYIAVEKLYALFLRNRRPFMTVLGKETILSYFSFFERVERGELKNVARADSILHEMQLLQTKEKE